LARHLFVHGSALFGVAPIHAYKKNIKFNSELFFSIDLHQCQIAKIGIAVNIAKLSELLRREI
jgi:hypothetical protein